jgi:FMN phosphatase YigB (HAD superfamily)
MVNYKIGLLLTIFFVSNSFSKNTSKSLSNVSPDSVVFAFDLHNVVVKPDIIQMLKVAFRELHKISFFTLINPRVWYNIIKYGAVPEQLVDRLGRKYNDDGFTKEFLIKVINNQVLDKQMFDLIKALKEKGYSVFLASNIWKSMLEDLLKQIPDLNDIFDGYFIPSKENNHIQKPNIKYYQEFKKYLIDHDLHNRQIIFIDNEEENLKTAKKEGFYTIKFTGIAPLIKRLNLLGIDLADNQSKDEAIA